MVEVAVSGGQDEVMLQDQGGDPEVMDRNRCSLAAQVAEEHGVTHMAAMCAICKAQFSKVLPMYGFDMEAIVSVHQMVSNAIILDRVEDNSQASDVNEG